MAATLTQNGTCACGKVKYEVSDSPIIMNSMCHCKTCSRMRSCSPVHLILIPAEKLVFTENEDLVEEKTYEGTKMMQAVCKSCGCGIYQCPEGAPFRALFPVCFQIEQGEKGAMLVSKSCHGSYISYSCEYFHISLSTKFSQMCSISTSICI